MKKYTISDISATLKVSERTAQRYVESLVNKDNNKIYVSEDVFNLLKLRHGNDEVATSSDTVENESERVEVFTEEEYQEFHKRLTEYPFLKERIEYILNDMEYYKNSIISKEKQMEILLNMMQQRNYIEAKEKKIE